MFRHQWCVVWPKIRTWKLGFHEQKWWQYNTCARGKLGCFSVPVTPLCMSRFASVVPYLPHTSRYTPLPVPLCLFYVPDLPQKFQAVPSCLCILPYMPQLSRQASCPSSCASSQSPIRPSCPSRLSHWPVLVLPLFMEFNKVFYRRFLTNKDVFILLIPINTRV